MAVNGNPWSSLFAWRATDYRGYVRDMDSAIDLIEEFAYATHTSYVTTRCTKNFGSSQFGEGKQACTPLHVRASSQTAPVAGRMSRPADVGRHSTNTHVTTDVSQPRRPRITQSPNQQCLGL